MPANYLHAALRHEILESGNAEGVSFMLVRLQHGKDKWSQTLHAAPTGFSTSGLQNTDLLAYLGLARTACTFLPGGQCYSAEVAGDRNLAHFTTGFAAYARHAREAARLLAACGYLFRQPEGLAFFGIGGPGTTSPPFDIARGDGHHSPKVDQVKLAEDDSFRYALTWIEGGADNGWVTHYHPKNSSGAEYLGVLASLFPQLERFAECPEFSFEPCWWRFEPFQGSERDVFGSAYYAHQHFDAHTGHFSKGILELMTADEAAQEGGFRFLVENKKSIPMQDRVAVAPARIEHAVRRRSEPQLRDVFLCHAGEDKTGIMLPLARLLQVEGVSCWQDEAEIEWGDDLVNKVNEGLRVSRYVVVILSPSFVGKPWPEKELNSALGLEASSGGVKVLPLLVGAESERKRILEAYPLLGSKKYLIWDGDGNAVVTALKRRLASG
jgi:TIR domain